MSDHFTPAEKLDPHLWVCKCGKDLSTIDKLAQVTVAPAGMHQLDGSFNCAYYCAFCEHKLKFFTHPQHDHVFMLNDAQSRHLLKILKEIYPEDAA